MFDEFLQNDTFVKMAHDESHRLRLGGHRSVGVRESCLLKIVRDDLSGEPTRELIALHLGGMSESSPPGHSFAIGIEELKCPEVTVWTAWSEGKIAGVAALRELQEGVGEIKSMRTHPAFLRQGVGTALLRHIIEVARERGLRRLSLETGNNAPFATALALYRRHGFVPGPAFGAYEPSEFNQFMHLELHADSETPEGVIHS